MNFNFILTNIFIRFIIKNGDGTPCSGGVTYETEYTFFSEDAAYILDIGKRELGCLLNSAIGVAQIKRELNRRQAQQNAGRVKFGKINIW